LKNTLVWKLIEKYALPRIATGAGDWPEEVPVSLILIATVDDLCSQLESLVPRPLNQETLSASPGSYIPALKFMLRELELFHQQAQNDKTSDSSVLPRLYSIGPLPSMKWRFVSLNAYTLASILPSIPTPNDPSDYLEVYNEVFDFQPLRIRR
jgi:hypothetical protein